MFPNYYNPYQQNYYNPYYQPNQQIPGRGQQIQGGFVRVPSEDVARNWNVLPGTSVTFLDENKPYCYTKTVDVSQLDRPRFEKYRLVKEDDAPADDAFDRRENALQSDVLSGGSNGPEYALKSELETLSGDVGALKRVVESLVAKTKKKGVKDDGESVD